MDAELAKTKFQEAQGHFDGGQFSACMAVLDELAAHFPGSRRVNYLKALCLASTGQSAEAEALAAELEGRLEPAQLDNLRKKIAQAAHRQPAGSPRDADTFGGGGAGGEDYAKTYIAVKPERLRMPDEPEPDDFDEPVFVQPLDDADYGGSSDDGDSNVFVVESAYSVGGDVTCVTGKMVQGVFHVGDSVSLISAEGLPLTAPIVRIGTKETPLRVLRQGQSASLFLKIDQSDVQMGSRITSGSSPEAFAATVLASTDPGATDELEEVERPAVSGGAGAAAPEVRTIERLINSNHYGKAWPQLQTLLQEHPDSPDAHRLMARMHLESEGSLNDPKQALVHAKKAFELDGTGKPAILTVLAEALGASGDPQHGIRYLENLYARTTSQTEKSTVENRIADFRQKYGLGASYEFRNEYGDVIFESSNIDEIAKAIQNGTVPRQATCRRNHVGEFRAVESTLALEHPAIRAIYTPARTQAMLPLLAAAGGGVVCGIIGAVIGGAIAGGAAAVLGAGLGWGAGAVISAKQGT